MQSWLQFIKERFDPLSHFLLIALFVAVHALFSRTSVEALNFIDVSTLFFCTAIFFFNLRLYDEIKDYETDKVINPTRPLPRGLISHKQMFKAIGFCIVTFLLITSLMGKHALFSGFLTILYSLLMYKEFFIGEKLRPHLTTYAMMHTLVTILLSLTLITSFKDTPIYQLSSMDLAFALSSWCFFNIFEFGRKTFLVQEERDKVDTYSSLFGKTGACLLTLSQGLLGTLFLAYSLYTSSLLVYLPLFYLVVISIPFVIKKNGNWGKIYRAGTSFYIILTYIILSIELS